jgi:hypothetical protein
MTILGVKTTETIYVFPLIGLNSIMCLNKNSCRLYLFAEDSGIILSEKEITHQDAQDINFEMFIEVAKKSYLDIINTFN